MSWLQELDKQRIYNYRKANGEIVRGTKKEFEDFFEVPLRCEPGEIIHAINGENLEYAGIEPIKCPGMGRMGGENSDRQISLMKKSFRNHFVKHELDDVRQKHGCSIDESLRAGEIRRKMNGDQD